MKISHDSWHNGRLSDGFRWLKILSVLKTKRESGERPHADAGCGHWSFTPDRAAALMPSMLPRLKSSEPINSRNPDVWWWKISLFDSQSMWIPRHFSDFLGEFYPKKMILKDDLSILHFYIYYILYYISQLRAGQIIYEYRLECILTDLNVSSLTLQPSSLWSWLQIFAVQTAPQQLDIIDSRKPPTCSRMKKLFWHAPCNSWRSMAINGCLGLGQDRRHPWISPILNGLFMSFMSILYIFYTYIHYIYIYIYNCIYIYIYIYYYIYTYTTPNCPSRGEIPKILKLAWGKAFVEVVAMRRLACV